MTEITVDGRPITRRPAIDVARSPREWLLAFVAGSPVVLETQVADLLKVRGDLPSGLVVELVGDGLVVEGPRFRGQGRAYRITADGLRVIGSDLSVPQVDLRRYWRDVGAGWLSVGARRGIFGEEVERVFTEREMRAADRRSAATGARVGAGWSETVRSKAADASFAVWPTVGGEQEPGEAHYPDVTVVVAQGRVAMQLVLEVPSRGWVAAVADAYARRANLVTTVFLVPGPGLLAPIAAIIERCGLSGRVMVQHARFVFG